MNVPYNAKCDVLQQDMTDWAMKDAATTDGMPRIPDESRGQHIAIWDPLPATSPVPAPEPVATLPEDPQLPDPADAPMAAPASTQTPEGKEQYQCEVDAAVLTLGREQHEDLGVLDAVKALFMVHETPEERVQHDRAVAADAAAEAGGTVPEEPARGVHPIA